jgi:hypothetical protein
LSPGLYAGSYGPHGTELVLLRCADSHTSDFDSALRPLPPTPAGPFTAWLEAVKVTGDENVPAQRHTFVAPLEQPNFASADTRPCVAFPRGAPLEVSLAARRPHLVRSLRCLGQINEDPRVWAPAWVESELQVYSPGVCVAGGGGQRCAFALVWGDVGRSHRHVIDYAAVEVAQGCGLCEWPCAAE